MIYQLALFVVLLPLIHAVSDGGKMTPENVVRDLNKIRREIAYNYSVPNMHELVWSESFVEIGKHVDYDDKKTWKGNRVTPILTYIPASFERYTKEVLTLDLETISSSWTTEERTRFFNGRREKFIYMLELFNPPQKHIGCFFKKPDDAFFWLCVVGDSSEFELWDFEKNSTSVPGSKCTPGYVNDDGLCVALPTTSTATRTTTKSTKKEVLVFDKEISHSSRVSLAVATIFYILWVTVV